MGLPWHQSIVVRGITMSGVGTIPAGWYADPSVPGQQRYWDGVAWTEHTAPGAPVPASPTAVTAARPFVADVAQRNPRSIWALAGALVLVAVVVLAAVAVPTFLSQRDRAQAAQVESDLRNTAIEFEVFYASQGRYPSSLADLPRQSITAEQVSVFTASDGQAFCLEASHGEGWWAYDSHGEGLHEGRC